MTRRAFSPTSFPQVWPRPALTRVQALLVAAAIGMALPSAANSAGSTAVATTTTDVEALNARVRVGDVVFTRIDVKPFREVADSTGSWTNHVGIVIGHDGRGPLVAESTFPLSKTTPLTAFVQRSQAGRVAVMRLNEPLDPDAPRRLDAAARQRMGVLYDTGFNLHSRRQFCSRFVHEVMRDATGVQLGEVQTLAQLLRQHPDANLRFWRLWYLGSIPWDRQTITPASLLLSARLQPVFDGRVDGGLATASQ